MRLHGSFLLLGVLVFLSHQPVYAGQQKHVPGPPPFARVKSPQMNEDGTVTFRIWAPKAESVKLQCPALLGEQSDVMTRFDKEYWHITITPARSGKFRYKFIVDDVQTPDPVNSLTVGTSSVVIVPGKETEFFTFKNVPHGSVHRHFYHNPEIEAVRSVSVYTPPDYQDNPGKVYPVLFLFHGSGGTDESWFRTGHANVILDNLIAAGKAQPMILVAPFGHTVEPGTHGWPFVQEQGDFIQDFLTVLLPCLNKNYRISRDAKDRALAGYSMGGYHTLKIGLNNLDHFAHLGLFSWGIDRFFKEQTPHVMEDPKSIDEKLSSFFLACGKDDFLFNGIKEVDALLTDLDIKHQFFVTDGGHEMTNWRRFLYEYAQVLFKQEY